MSADKVIRLNPDQAEIIIRALSEHATDEMRFAAWDVLDAAIHEAAGKLP